jgi:hypothetical protein
MSRHSIRLIGTLSTVVLAAACQSAGGSSRASLLRWDESAASIRGTTSNRVGADELKALDDQSLEEALMRLRPNFLRAVPGGAVRPGSATLPSVYIDNSYVGAPDALRLVPVIAVMEVLYLPPAEAHDRFGAYCPCAAGVIVVVTRRSK